MLILRLGYFSSRGFPGVSPLAILDLVDKAKNFDLCKQLGEYIDKVQHLHRDNNALAAKVLNLSDQLRLKGRVEYTAGHTFVEGWDQEICPPCADVDHKTGSPAGHEHRWQADEGHLSGVQDGFQENCSPNHKAAG